MISADEVACSRHSASEKGIAASASSGRANEESSDSRLSAQCGAALLPGIRSLAFIAERLACECLNINPNPPTH
jgi:hypothetical protein